MTDVQKPVIAITMGDPCGIGPEVIAKALTSEAVYLLTTHRSLRRACDYVTKDRILGKLELTQDSFRR